MGIRKDDRITLLRGVELFSSCSTAELRKIAGLATEHHARAGQVLARQDERGHEFFVIVEGRAEASRNGVVLAELAPTDFFGELAILDGGTRTATVVAMTDLRLLVLSSAEFKQLYQFHPAVTRKIVAVLGARLRKADEMLGADRRGTPGEYLTL
jgi:CRP-like cAMP-binding protein